MRKSRKWRILMKKISEKEERAEQELSLNFKNLFPINSKKDFWNFIDFLYGKEFKKVFAELQN